MLVDNTNYLLVCVTLTSSGAWFGKQYRDTFPGEPFCILIEFYPIPTHMHACMLTFNDVLAILLRSNKYFPTTYILSLANNYSVTLVIRLHTSSLHKSS